MEDAEVRATQRRVLWLMIPVVIVALVIGTITFFFLWGITHPGVFWDG